MKIAKLTKSEAVQVPWTSLNAPAAPRRAYHNITVAKSLVSSLTSAQILPQLSPVELSALANKQQPCQRHVAPSSRHK
jgi:hypothetical protein